MALSFASSLKNQSLTNIEVNIEDEDLTNYYTLLSRQASRYKSLSYTPQFSTETQSPDAEAENMGLEIEEVTLLVSE